MSSPPEFPAPHPSPLAPPVPLRAVVFDLDGLMFNTEDLYQYVGGEVLRRRGKTFDHELLDQMMGRVPQVALQLMIDYHQLPDTVAGLASEGELIFAEILESRLELMPGLTGLLVALEQAKIPRAIGTSSGPKFVQRVLSQFNLAPWFQFILTCEDVAHGKPNPEIYLTAAQRFNVRPEEMMVLEDSENGCRAAVASGAFAVAVPSGHSHTHNFTGAALVAETLADSRIYRALGLVT